MFKITPIDDKKVEDGVWANYLGVEFHVRRGDTEAIRERQRIRYKAWWKEHPEHPRSEPVPADVLKAIAIDVWLEANVVTSWRKASFKGDLPEFTSSNFRNLMEHDEDCFQFLIGFVTDRENFYREAEEAKLALP